MGLIAAVLAGVMGVPLLLPYLPTEDYSVKGFALGGLVAFPFTYLLVKQSGALSNVLASVSLGLSLTAVTSFLALNFTGATPYASRSGVKLEIQRYVPTMALFFMLGLAGLVIRGLLKIWR